jgi:hypothetical protein
MDYQEICLPPARIYEAFKEEMRHGDKVSRYIVECMDEEWVVSKIYNTRIPRTVKDAIRKANRNCNICKFCFCMVWLLTFVFMPLAFLGTIVALMIGTIFLLADSFELGLAICMFGIILFSTYMLFYNAGAIIFNTAVHCIIRAATIMANLQCWEDFHPN